LTAKGRTGEELKKTVLGSAKVQIERANSGSSLCYQKFSLCLNFSQLFKFQLPDMVSGGMPYEKITATLAAKDGIVTSNDLYVASDAINISAVEKSTWLRDELDRHNRGQNPANRR